MMPFPVSAYTAAAGAMQDAEWRLAKSASDLSDVTHGDPVEGLVGVQLAKTQVAVNAKTLKSLDESVGNLLDIFA